MPADKHEFADMKVLEEKLELLLVQVRDRCDHIDRRNEKMDGKIDRVADLLTGSSGLIIRVDRLEQEAARKDWWVKTTAGAVVGCIVGLVFGAIKLFS